MSRLPVCVFAKPPVPGTVKTRLAKEIGPERAAALARAFFADVWGMVQELPWARGIAAVTSDPEPLLGLRLEQDAWLQGDGDLGQRLEHILRRALSEAEAAMAIGADTPGLPRAYLAEAHEALETADAVLGPSDDGGFYLLGLKRCPPGLLANIAWSQETTRAETVARLAAMGFRIHLLPPWFDVDTGEDLARLSALLRTGAVRAPRTSEALVRLGLEPRGTAPP